MPSIIKGEDMILVSDRPTVWKIFLAVFGACAVIYLYLLPASYNKPLLMIIALAIFLAFAYDCLSLKRIKVDLKQRVVYRRSANPLENVIASLLQHPAKIPFANIEKIYADYVDPFKNSQQFYVYIRTDDPYNLKIASFNNEAAAVECADYLSNEIWMK